MSEDIEEAVADPYAYLPQTQQYSPVPLLATVMQIAPLRSQDTQVPGVYVAVCRDDRIRRWGGAMVFAKKNPISSEFMAITRIMNESDMGYTITTLADGPVGYWDYISTVQVTMISGVLESRDELDVLNGANLAMVGNEIIAYQSAELIDENTYELSTLLRGLRNTQDEVNTHTANDRFIPLSRDLVQFIPFDVKDINVPFTFKVVSGGGDPDNENEISVTTEGINLQPFAPVNLRADLFAGDLRIRWDRRTREVTRLFLSGSSIYLEETETYEIDLSTMSGPTRDPTGIVNNPLVVENATEHIYNGAERTEDGYVLGDPLDISVYQISSSFGRGKAGVISI